MHQHLGSVVHSAAAAEQESSRPSVFGAFCGLIVLDGASTTQMMRKIIAPIAAPGIAATSLICFIFSWSEQLFAKVLTSVNARTAPVFVSTPIQTEHSYLAQLCTGTVAISLPVLIAGFAAQNKLVQGLSLGAVK